MSSLAGYRLSHLDELEAEAIHIFREVAAEFRKPVLLYSMGKDSTCMLRVAQKAFHPGRIPFPLLHIDSLWEFKSMYAFREQIRKDLGVDIQVWVNPEGKKQNINPFDHGSEVHTRIMRTDGLKQALDHYGFDAAFGGGRRDEEKSRAKERFYSFRDRFHQWDPKNQRPELWRLYNSRVAQGESIRVFPLSNWTELDVWLYILREKLPIVPEYFAAERPVVARPGGWILADDERMRFQPGEKPEVRRVRFRTLGCYPLTAGIDSDADTLEKIVSEMFIATTSERQGRVIDHDGGASMEEKKREGYF